MALVSVTLCVERIKFMALSCTAPVKKPVKPNESSDLQILQSPIRHKPSIPNPQRIRPRCEVPGTPLEPGICGLDLFDRVGVSENLNPLLRFIKPAECQAKLSRS